MEKCQENRPLDIHKNPLKTCCHGGFWALHISKGVERSGFAKWGVFRDYFFCVLGYYYCNGSEYSLLW